jgi:hypothetical protein
MASNRMPRHFTRITGEMLIETTETRPGDIIRVYKKMIWAIVDIIRAQIAIFTYSFLCCEMLKYSNYRRFYNEH